MENANARCNIAHGSVRSGKTVGLNLKFIEEIGETGKVKGAHHIMIGRTERTLAGNVLDPIQDYLGKRNFNYSTGTHMAYMFGVPIQLYGASDIRAEGKIRGLTGCKALGDEMTIWPKGFMNMLMTRLSVEDSRFHGSTNPDSPYHEIKTNYIDKAGVNDLKEFHFALEDNPFLPKKYVQNLKKEFSGLFYKRFIMGEWVLAEGSIFDFFEEKEPYVFKKGKLPKAKWYTAGIDYGTSNAFVCVLVGHNPDATPSCWAEKEYYYSGRDSNKQKTDLEYCEDLKEFFGEIRPRKIIVDPSATSFKVQASRSGLMGITDADNDVLNGIATHSRMLKNGDFSVSDECGNSIREYMSYVWDEKAQDKGEDKPKKQNDHAMDAIRYALHTQFGQDYLDYSKLVTW